MSGGVIVVAAVVGALALFETVLPWAFTALRRWRRRARGEEKNADGFAVRKVGEMACGYDGPSGLRHNAISPRLSYSSNDAALAFSDSGVARAEKEGQIPSAGVVVGSENAKSAYRASDLRSNEADANRLWEEARGMTHRFKPDEIKDGEYLRKIQMAAELGHLEAMAKLGTYAFRRKRYVEAFYWRWRAEAGGWHETEKPTLREIRLEWRLRGCPTEYDNDFGEERGKFARTVLRLQCGVDAAGARQRLKRLAERGVEEARLFLGKHQPQGPACEVRLVGGVQCENVGIWDCGSAEMRE